MENGLPKQLVETVGWDNGTDEDEEDIRIIDFGAPFRASGRAGKACAAGRFASTGDDFGKEGRLGNLSRGALCRA